MRERESLWEVDWQCVLDPSECRSVAVPPVSLSAMQQQLAAAAAAALLTLPTTGTLSGGSGSRQHPWPPIKAPDTPRHTGTNSSQMQEGERERERERERRGLDGCFDGH